MSTEKKNERLTEEPGFFRRLADNWMGHIDDPYEGRVEVRPVQIITHTEEERRQAEEDLRRIRESLYQENKTRQQRRFAGVYKGFSVIFCILLCLVMLAAVSEMPIVGEAGNPVNNEVSRRYLESGVKETGAINLVTGMILDYRAFDTLGESHVLFTATIAVMVLLRIDRKNRKALSRANLADRTYEPKNDWVLQFAARALVPMVLIFGAYIILAGHLGPGGGFSGGAVMGAGLILFLNAFGFRRTGRFFNEKVYRIMTIGALGCYALAKSYSFYTGANEIHSVIPLGTPGDLISSGLILILNICVGIVVAGTMYTFYCLFRKGDF